MKNFTRVRVSLALLSLRKNGGLLVVQNISLFNPTLIRFIFEGSQHQQRHCYFFCAWVSHVMLIRVSASVSYILRLRKGYLPGTMVACSRLSDSGEDAKEKGTRKVGGAGSPQFPPVLFSCLRFRNSADPTISEPGTGQNDGVIRGAHQSYLTFSIKQLTFFWFDISLYFSQTLLRNAKLAQGCQNYRKLCF